MNETGKELWNDWQTMARQSWQAWSDMARSGGASAPPKNAADPASATVQRMLDGLQSWQQWMQNATASNLSGQDWQQNLQHMFQRGGQPFVQAFGGLDSSGAHGFEHMMQQWMAMQPSSGGQAWNAMQQPAAGLRDMLGMPAFGFSREQQEQQQQLALAMLDYTEKMRAYNTLISRANLDGVERMQTRLAERSANDKPVESLRGLYDLWVDVAEEAYADVAMSDEFRAAYGDLVNAQMHLRLLQQKQVQQMCAQLGMPTRNEVDSIGKRLQELRREMRSSGVSALTEQIAALRAQVEHLRKTGSDTATKAAPAKAKAAPVTGKASAATKKSAPKAARQSKTAKAGVKNTVPKKAAKATSKR